MSDRSPYTNPEILARVAAGSETAFTELVVTHKLQLEAFVRNMTKSDHLTDEIVQNTFIQVWITREGLTRVDNFSSYLFIICRNQVLNAMRNILRSRKRERAWAEGNTEAYSIQPDHQHEIFLEVLQGAIDQLPPQQKKAWELSRRMGKKYVQIAEEMGVTRETVKKHIQLANAFIVQHLRARKDAWLVIAWLIYKS